MTQQRAGVRSESGVLARNGTRWDDVSAAGRNSICCLSWQIHGVVVQQDGVVATADSHCPLCYLIEGAPVAKNKGIDGVHAMHPPQANISFVLCMLHLSILLW